MTLTWTFSPTVATWSGVSTWPLAISEMWTRPSTPSPSSTNDAERDELGDLALDDRADREVLDELLPRVLRGLLETERDALAVEVDVEHLHVDRVADLDDLGRVVDVAPGQLGDVHEAVDAAEVDERTEVDDRGDVTRQDHALLQLAEDLGALVLAALFEDDAAREDDVVAVAVHLDDAGLETRAECRREVLDATEVDERRRQEAAQADVEDETALDDLDDLALDVLAGVELLFDLGSRRARTRRASWRG